jgi:hypothetical protein
MANTTNVEARKTENNEEIEYYTDMTFTESGERTKTAKGDTEYTAVSDLPRDRDVKEATISISYDSNEKEGAKLYSKQIEKIEETESKNPQKEETTRGE